MALSVFSGRAQVPALLPSLIANPPVAMQRVGLFFSRVLPHTPMLAA